GVDFATVNPNGYVPVLQLDDGALLSEGIAIVQYLADLNPEAGLAPPAHTPERVSLQSWLALITTELHKMHSPWLFHPEYGAEVQAIARRKIGERLAFVEAKLAEGGPFLLGERFTAADAYLFTIVGWSAFTKVDLAPFSALRAFMERVGARPKVRAAAQGLKAA